MRRRREFYPFFAVLRRGAVKKIMAEFHPLTVVLLLLAVTLGAVTVLNILRLPTLPAYFIAGVAAGPHGIGILESGEEANFIAELGVIFLLFTIGLEFSLPAFNRIRRYVLLLGSLQVGVCMAVFGAGGWLLTRDVSSALLIGAVAAMSSTAIVSQLLINDNAVTSPAGRRAIAVLLFQDIAVVPFIVIFSSLSTMQDISALPVTMAWIVIKGTGLVLAVFIVFRPLIGKWFNWAHRHGDKELFMLNLMSLIVIGAGLTAAFGLSYSLGAFLAGMIIAETMHRHRVERTVEPFRHLFLGFFFISLGLLIDPNVLYENWPVVFGIAAVYCVVKTAVVYGLVRVIGAFRRTSLRSALLLGGAGEFGFVLLTIAGGGMMEEKWFQIILLSNLLAMLPVSLIWPVQDKIAEKVFPHLNPEEVPPAEQKEPKECDIIVSGFGRTGQAVAGVFREMGIEYAVIEDDYRILQAVGGAENIIYGEGERLQSLDKSGLSRAKVFIITYMETASVISAVQSARRINSKVWIVVKASDAAQAESFARAGADEVLIESHEAGFSLARLAARKLGGDIRVISHTIKEGRRRVNSFFSGEYGGAEERDASGEPVRHFVGCVVGGDVSGAQLTEMIRGGSAILSWRRGGESLTASDALWRGVSGGDELVLMGGNLSVLTDIKNKLEGATDFSEEE